MSGASTCWLRHRLGLAAAGGSLVAVMVAIQPEMGQVYTFKSFLVIVLGGRGTIRARSSAASSWA